jgi:hypothetical protein
MTTQERIFDHLTTERARDYWRGMVASYRNEFVDIALRRSVEAAADAVEEAAAPQEDQS